MLQKTIFLILLTFLLTSCGTSVKMLTQDDFLQTESITLSPELEEISSLEIQGDTFFGINDSGGETKIYSVSPKNPDQIKQYIFLRDTKNIDWEATAQSDSLMFIGDFGNNMGNREDLKIYYINKKETLSQFTFQEQNAEVFSFFYPEQTDYSKQLHNHDFDAESLVYFGDKLHLFTKEWKSAKTHHYTLDIVTGKQPAWLIESFDIGFFVTGADVLPISKNKSKLALVGYTKEGDVYLLLTWFRNKSEKWLDKPKKQIYLGFSGDVGQVEGVAFKSEDEICYSAEKIITENKIKEQSITCIKLK